jgi:hypothetical protein
MNQEADKHPWRHPLHSYNGQAPHIWQALRFLLTCCLAKPKFDSITRGTRTCAPH